MRIYNSASELSADARITLAVKETGFAEKKVTELVAVGKACEYPLGIVPTEENENAADGTVSDELIIRLAEFDMTGAYAEQVTKIIGYMNGTYIKEKFYAIPLEELSKVNKHNAKPKLPFYKKPRTIEQQ